MSTRLLLLSASAAAFLLVQPAAAQGLPYEVQFRCTFQNNFNHPLVSQDCDNEYTERAAFSEPEREYERPKHHKFKDHKFKKKLIRHWFDPRSKPNGHVMQHDTYGSPSNNYQSASQAGSSGNNSHSDSGVAGAVSNTVSRTTESLSRTVGSLLD